MKKYYFGIDNGTSGTCALLTEDGEDIFFIETPIKHEQSYTKEKKNISRVDAPKLRKILAEYTSEETHVVCMIERPLVNSRLFRSSMSAMRALESTLCILEEFNFSIMYCDSKNWQHEMLPRGTKGTPALKKASMDISLRLFPKQKEVLMKHKDGDALLIAEWARRHNL